jgi:hypothetical protein
MWSSLQLVEELHAMDIGWSYLAIIAQDLYNPFDSWFDRRLTCGYKACFLDFLDGSFMYPLFMFHYL